MVKKNAKKIEIPADTPFELEDTAADLLRRREERKQREREEAEQQKREEWEEANRSEIPQSRMEEPVAEKRL